MKSPSPKILVVEDEPKILTGIVDALELQGFEVVSTTRGDEALTLALIQNPDLVVLDIMLPKLSGLDVCQNLRKSGVKAPIIFLTAKGGESDRVAGLELGADDYMTKPFSIKELIARINAHLRRRNIDALEAMAPATTNTGLQKIKFLTVDFDARACWLHDEPLHLSEKEFSILKILVENLGKVVSRYTLLKEVWGYTNLDLETRTVDVTIGKLRQKIEKDVTNPEIIKTKRGSGSIIEGPY
ncbi:MAG: response regulator transcription factor [Acidobacteria bacterium]|nr:response regulator transcription factor [Acidobacteriota bacterium]